MQNIALDNPPLGQRQFEGGVTWDELDKRERDLVADLEAHRARLQEVEAETVRLREALLRIDGAVSLIRELRSASRPATHNGLEVTTDQSTRTAT